jgi:hypothetical protein
MFSFFSPKDFLSLACTCKFFKRIFEEGEFWKAYTAKLGSRAIIFPTNIQVDSSSYFDFVKSAVSKLGLMNSDASKFPQTLIPVEASSTDFCQTIEKALSDEKLSFWSTTGSDSQESVDSLLFLFRENMVVPFSVTVTFFTAEGFYEGGTLEFPSKRLQVQFSFDGVNWEYESDIVEVNARHQVEIKILGKVGLARYMRVCFIGKTVLQPTDDLYYVAVEKVQCSGYSVLKNDQDNQTFNDQLIKSYIAWQKNKPSVTEEEILDYYNNKTFKSDFINTLETGNNEDIWAIMEKFKYLYTLGDVYVDIFNKARGFGAYYFKKIIQEKKRRAFNENETLLLFLLFLDASKNENLGFHQVSQYLSNHFSYPELATIQYLSISTKVLSNIWKVADLGHPLAVEFLKNNKKIIFDEPIDYPEETASIVLFNYIMVSKAFSDAQSSQTNIKK